MAGFIYGKGAGLEAKNSVTAFHLLRMIVKPSLHDSEFSHAIRGPEACPRCVAVRNAKKLLSLIDMSADARQPASSPRKKRGKKRRS